jgi:surface antigen
LAGPVNRLFRRTLYSGSGKARLWRGRTLPRLWLGKALAVLLLGPALGGCSLSSLETFVSKDTDARAEHTGSIAAAEPAKAGLPADGDLAFTRAAAAELLTRGGKDTSVPWENPRTGARGTVTPIAAAYTQDGLTCRDFLASYVRNGAEAWMQGEACRERKGKWEIRSLKPWKRS